MNDARQHANTDHLTRFLIDGAGVRGVRVHLHDAWREIRARMHEVAMQSPAAVELLGEAITASALFTGHTKVEGRLAIQLQSRGPLRTLFAECTSAGNLRGIVRLAAGAGAVSRDLATLEDGSVLAITVENPGLHGREPVRYQGLVGLEADSLAGAFEDYFRQSEQLPTRLLLVADEHSAAGLMLQKLPGDEGDEDGWARASALFDTLRTTELLELPDDTLLTRLFHEDGVRILGGKPLQFGCSCSLERVESMLVSLGSEEALAAAGAGGTEGVAEIHCEFCGEHYRLQETRIRELLDRSATQVAGPERTQ